MKRKTPEVARPNRKVRRPAAQKDGGPPPPRLQRVKRAFAPRSFAPPSPESAAAPMYYPPPPPASQEENEPQFEIRHLRRLIEGILLETRTTRQYIQWLHEMLAHHELGKESKLPSSGDLKRRAAQGKRAERQALSALLARRAGAGIGNNGMDLTPQEQARIAAGEPIDQVLGIDE